MNTISMILNYAPFFTFMCVLFLVIVTIGFVQYITRKNEIKRSRPYDDYMHQLEMLELRREYELMIEDYRAELKQKLENYKYVEEDMVYER